MNFEDVKEIINIFDKSSLTYIDLKLDNCTICMDKSEKRRSESQSIENDSVKINDEKAVTLAYDKKLNINEKQEIKEEIKSGKYITSPIVGTFYASPTPNSDNFVKVGDKIKKGTVLCIIESMKLMNEIESDLDGEVVEILVEDGAVVEYGQNLFRII